MDIDFIKWMCGKAEGFEWQIGSGLQGVRVLDTISFFSDNEIVGNTSRRITEELFPKVYYPLLIQRAIESVNIMSFKTNGRYEIIFRRWGLFIVDYLTLDEIDFRLEKFESIEQSKESALKYIYEQEKK